MTPSFLSISTVLAAGLVSFFSPCILPLLPVYLSLFHLAELRQKKTQPDESFVYS